MNIYNTGCKLDNEGMTVKKGFVTVATGNDQYYQLAANLLLSYKKRGAGTYPFALICDRTNEYTDLFDDVVIVQDVRKSTVDKLLMRYSPYDENLFLDADTLILENIDDLWDVFGDQDDVSVFGCILPLDSQDGWFTYEGSGKYKPRVSYLLSMNGGIYYFRKTEKAAQVFREALEVIDDYASIDFKYFDTPQDEPLMAMSMVINGCLPCTSKYDMLILPVCEKRISTDYLGNVYEGKTLIKAKMIHFSTPRTALFLYHYLDAVNHNEEFWKTPSRFVRMKLKYMHRDLQFNAYHLAGAMLRKAGLGDLVEKLKSVLR